MRRRAKVYAQSAVYIDPTRCDSLVGYCITSRTRLSASVDLQDCDRRIKWYFYDEANSITKIDKAIQMLTNFKRDFVSAQKQWKASKRKAK